MTHAPENEAMLTLYFSEELAPEAYTEIRSRVMQRAEIENCDISLGHRHGNALSVYTKENDGLYLAGVFQDISGVNNVSVELSDLPENQQLALPESNPESARPLGNKAYDHVDAASGSLVGSSRPEIN